jgi:arylsulfatase A-like enzyme
MIMPKNLVFVLSDQHRWDASRLHDDRVHTPNLERLARESTYFSQTFCQAQACVPSRTCLMTGQYAETHGVWNNQVKMAPTQATWPDHLRKLGYQTVAVGRTHEIDLGFGHVIRVPSADSYPINCHDPKLQKFWSADAYIGPSPVPFEQYYETRITNTAIEFLHEMKRGEEPFALYVGYLTPHAAFTPPANFWNMYKGDEFPRGDQTPPPADVMDLELVKEFQHITEERHQQIARGYYAQVSTTDACVGMLMDELDRLGLSEDTLFVYTSDHGEALGHRMLYSKRYGYDSSIRVPLFMRCPGTVKSDVQADHLVEHVDLASTICEALGVEPMRSAGKSFWSLCTQEDVAEQHRDYVYSAIAMDDLNGNLNNPLVRSALGNGQVCRDQRWKWIHRVTPNGSYDEVYNLEIDPSEQNNLVDTQVGQEVKLKFLQQLQDKSIRDFRTQVLDFYPDAKQSRLIPFFTK